MQQGKTVSRTLRFEHEHNKLRLVVETHNVELPNGKVVKEWPWIDAPEFVNVLAITQSGRFICLKQSKYCLPEKSIAPVGGYIENNELPLDAAKRELLEETGYESTEWIDLGKYRVDPNWGISTGYFFLARDAYSVREPSGDDLEDQQLMLLTKAEVKFSSNKWRDRSLGMDDNICAVHNTFRPEP